MFTADEQLTFIRSDGEEFLLNLPPTRAVFNMTGWGKPPETLHTISGPFQHGNTVVSYRLNPRIINLDLYHRECTRAEYHAGRSRLVNQMGLNNASSNSPASGVLKWEYFIDSVLNTRCLDVFLTKGLGFTPLEGWQKNSILESLEFTAPNPVIYDPTAQTSTVSSFTEMLYFAPFGSDPVYFPFTLGTTIYSGTIAYIGTWETKPTIIISGPAYGLSIFNRSTDKKISLNYSVSLGETVTIVLDYNNISVTNDIGQNLMYTISDDSDLGEFTLQPYQIIEEDNDIYIEALGIDANTSIVFSYYNRYYGI